MRRNVKYTLLIIALAMIMVISGCGTNVDPEKVGLTELSDKVASAQILDYNLIYRYCVPGAYLMYGDMWGTRNDHQFGRTQYTYLTEYSNDDGLYYFVYIKSSVVNDIMPWLKEYESKCLREDTSMNYHFSKYDNKDAIDGKYLYAYQNMEGKKKKDVICYTSDSYNNVPHYMNGYELVFCCKKKTVALLENATTKESLNVKIPLYVKYCLEFNEKNKEFVVNENAEKAFDFVGQRLEVCDKSFEAVGCAYSPMIGIIDGKTATITADVVTIEGKKYVVLPRYTYVDEKKVDFTDESVDLMPPDDVFLGLRTEFADAYCMAYDEANVGYDYDRFGLFDYDKVVKIIK